MNVLDMRTMIFTNMVINVLGVLVVAFLWYQNRKRFAGTSFWVLDFAFQATATWLIMLRGSVPDWMSIVLANTLLIAGALAGYMGLEHFVGKIGTQIHNYILLAAFALVYSYFVFVQPNLAVRIIILSLGLLILCFQCLWLMLRRVQPGMRPMTRSVGLVFGAFCLVSLIRIVAILANPQLNNDFFLSGTFDTLSLLSYQILLILLAFGLTLMVNKRLLMEVLLKEEKLKELSIHDPLTGLYNRGLFEEEMARLERGRQFPVSIVMADLNDLKATNDRDGHAAGDALLQRAAQVLNAAFRADDIITRIGGDEFAVLLPKTDAASAQQSLRRVRHALDEHNAAHGGTLLSIALGVSTAEKGVPLADALKEADARMYEDKHGRANTAD